MQIYTGESSASTAEVMWQQMICHKVINDEQGISHIQLCGIHMKALMKTIKNLSWGSDHANSSI
jgi:hypothetical protein